MADVTCILFIAIGFFMFGVVSTETYPCGTGTIYPERGTQVVVDCDVQSDHIAVFWYRGSTGSDPFLRLENRLKTESDGFNIQDNGAMVITSADVTHDGLYVNRVIGNDGLSRDTNITVEVKVSLASEPVIVDCSSSIHDVCTSVEVGKRKTTLACIVGPAKPPVSISWSSSDGTKQQSDYSSTQNGSTSLYTSTSLLEYNSRNYLLEYFTCSVNGEAASTVTTGVFMKGNQNINVQPQGINYVKSGTDVTLECPLASGGTLGEWGIEFPNNTYRWLWRKYPGFEGGPCIDADDCEVQANGNLHLSKVTYINEGHYECTYSSAVLKFQVEVLVSPKPQETVIKGCEDKDYCELNVANSGTLECSIFGSRPSINPEVTVDKEFHPDDSSEVFIFGEELVSVVGSLPGTFDTVLHFEYTIPECSDVVRIECFAGDNTHSDEIMKTTVHLVTATSGCDQGGGRPGLIVFLVLFFLFLLLLIVGIVLYVFKRDYILEKLGKRSRRNPDALKVGYVPTRDNEHKTKFSHQVEHIPVVENVDIDEAKTSSLQQIFDGKFQPIYKEITGNTAKYEDFNEMMNSFSSENKVNIPVPYLAEFLKNKSNSNEEVLQVLKFVIEHFDNQWVGYFLKMLDDLLATKQVTATNYITLIGSLVQKRVIGLSRYVELTGAFLSNNTASFDIILAALKNLIDKRYCSREDFSNTFLQYYLGNYITDNDVIKELSAETEAYKFLPPYFLQSVYQEMKEKNETKAMRKLSAIFKKVWDQMMGASLKLEPHHKDTNKKTTYSERQQQETQTTENQKPLSNPDDEKEGLNETENQNPLSNPADEKEGLSETEKQKEVTVLDTKEDKVNEKLRYALIQALLFAVDSEKISSSECVDMIRDTKLPQNELENLMSAYINDSMTTAKIAFGLLEKTLMEKVISDEAYIKLFWLFVTVKKEVTLDNFMEHIKTLLQHNLISERCFEKMVTKLIAGEGMQEENKDKKGQKKSAKKKSQAERTNYFSNHWDGDEWIKFVTGLVLEKKLEVTNVDDTNNTDNVDPENLIGNSLRMTLYQCVVDAKKIKKGKVEKVIKKEFDFNKKKETKPLLANVKF